jgi:hypothetical protein
MYNILGNCSPGYTFWYAEIRSFQPWSDRKSGTRGGFGWLGNERRRRADHDTTLREPTTDRGPAVEPSSAAEPGKRSRSFQLSRSVAENLVLSDLEMLAKKTSE